MRKRFLWLALILALIPTFAFSQTPEREARGYFGIVGGDTDDKGPTLVINPDGSINAAVTGAGSGGTSMTDDAAFTPGTGGITPMGCFGDETAPDSINEGDGGVVRCTLSRKVLMVISDPTSEFHADVFDLTNSNPLATQIVDANGDAITSFGGGTQYTEGDTDATITGNALLFEGAANALVAAPGTAANGLLVDVSRVQGTVTVSGTVTANLGATDNAVLDDIADGIPITGSMTPGTGATNLGKAEDAAHSTGDVGVAVWGVRSDADAALGANGDYAPLQFDANGYLKVNIKAGAGSGGTAMADDAAFTVATTSVTPIGAMLDNTSPDSVDEGDAGIVRMSANRNLFVTIRDAAGNERGLNIAADGSLAVTGAGGGTQYAEDAALGSTPTGTLSMCRRDDALSSLTPVENDAVGIRCDSLGSVWVSLGTRLDSTNDSITVVGAAAHDAAVSGNPLLLGAYASSSAPTNVSANGDAVRLWADLAGRLQVGDGGSTLSIDDGGGSITIDGSITCGNCSGSGVSVNEDVASASADPGTPAYSVRQDTPAGTTSADGDYQPLKTDSIGRLWVNCGTGCSGGTQYTEDAASAGGETVTLAGAIRQDTISSSTSADGDFTNLKVNNVGRLYTSSSIDAALPAGTNNIGDVDVLSVPADPFGANADAASATGSISAKLRFIASTGIPITGSVTVTDGSGALNVICDSGCSGGTQYAEDSASADGDTVTLSGAVRQDTLSSNTSADGDRTYLKTTSAGRLWTSSNIDQINGVTPLMGAGNTGTGSLRTTEATDSQLSAGVGATGDAAATAGSTGSLSAKQRLMTTQLDAIQTAVQLIDDDQTGASVNYKTSAGTTEDETEIKATAGRLFSITATNTNAAARYIRCANLTAANTTPGTSTVFLGLAIPGNTAGSGFTTNFGPAGIAFSTALTCWTVTGAADTDVAEVAANEIKWIITYK